MKKYRKYIIAVLTVLLIAIGLTACGKSTAQDLQSHQWTFASSKDNGTATTAKFSKENLTLSQAGFSEVYSYKLTKRNGDEQIKFVGKNSVSGSTETRLFKIKKQSDKYKLTPINTLAKSDTGTVSLIPK
ncbi:hypothetical protein OLJ37_15700 (plasmid) [Lactiplantibacillus plantarum]|uniref:hypothetical protein n=1 Tax=Lactiplantibacillus plantarum TaxID=1590 RepID=UPI00223243C1|nr:hypothetical protein [Lactiplantibacillus plantarum]MCG0714404.1 hypothetical protein [Lactiplantibacillus plantarum]MCG0896372.1 hypothetical protein [Lactiplantibacillus plantarum]UZD35076.1 hypothetical protein OLJ37_15700 [Lactiplantibacillus plantarum]WHQ52924.1 hypothetical protein M1852_15165 [Lactiplantibacillus plantarum]